MNELKKLIRSILRAVLYNGWYRWVRSWDESRNGAPLKDGITAVVSAKNEAYIIPFCLESLVGVVDQVVCIDNGSDDGTLEAMNAFKEKFAGRIEVDILEMPNALLGDCRNAGLDYTRYKWHLRWDADMVCRTSGKEDMKLLREKVLKMISLEQFSFLELILEETFIIHVKTYRPLILASRFWSALERTLNTWNTVNSM